MKVIEIAMFRLLPEVSEAAFRSALADTDRWLAKQRGFIVRRHGAGDGERVDYAEWESMTAAKEAAEAFMSAPETQAFMAAIDPASISVKHYQLAS